MGCCIQLNVVSMEIWLSN